MNSDAFWSHRRNGEKSTRRSVLQMLNVYIKEIREFIKYRKDMFGCETTFLYGVFLFHLSSPPELEFRPLLEQWIMMNSG